MKRNYLLTGALLLAISSCTNEVNEEGFVDKANCISFNAYSSKTRAEDPYSAGDVDISVMKTGSFGVVGYTQSNNKLYLGSTSKAIEQYWKADTNIEGGGSWEYKDPTEQKYWPADVMDFFAYFPYSADGATFADPKNDTDPVMTIKCTRDDQDILFSRIHNKAQDTRVHMFFNHALSKIKSIEIQVNAVDVNVTVSKVEILNTSTKGDINVGADGVAIYSNGSDIRTFDISPAKTITLSTEQKQVDGVLFDNSANGYLFGTNSTEHNYVIGTGKTMWNGSKDVLNGGNLSESAFVVMKLTCKVEAAGHYLVGSADTFGEMYIPMKGISGNSADISELAAGRRYTYKIVMSSNVGYKDNGDPIMLAPIRFGVNQIVNWDDVEVTVNL